MPKPNLNDVPLEWIRAFEVAGRLGSFTSAAQETGLTQAAISQRIGHLERRIGARLFLRKPRGVILTVEGEAWLPYVSAALATLRESSQDLFGARGAKLTISASVSVTQLWLVPRLTALPDEMEIVFTSMVLEADFRGRESSVEIRYGLGDWPGRYKARLFDEILSPVANIKSEDWHLLPRIGVSGPRPGWHEWAHATGDPATPTPSLRFDSYGAALAAASAGNGVVMASLPLSRQALETGAVKRVSKQTLTPDETYWICADKSAVTKRQWGRLTRAFCDVPPES